MFALFLYNSFQLKIMWQQILIVGKFAARWNMYNNMYISNKNQGNFYNSEILILRMIDNI